MQEFNNVPLEFDVSLYGTLEQFDDSKSKCRVRIFYKGLNRNRTYISEEFANQLISSLPYAPIKGIFNHDDVDFEGHGDKNSDGKIYGLVMAEPNFAWEDHLDTDGVTRTYACADVLLYTSLYNEAKMIPDSSQSMEINPYTFTGEWKIWEEDGQPYYQFYKGSLFGLQALGTTIEPCFEGAAFYNLMFEKLSEDYQTLVGYAKQFSKKEEKAEMDMTLFRLSDNEKADLLFTALNPNFNEENWEYNYCILDVYDDYAICRNRKENKFERVYYTKDDTNNTVSIGDKVEVFITDVTETEYAALETMKAIGNGSYEAANIAYTALNTKAESLAAEVETLNTSLAEANSKLTEAETVYNTKVEEYEATIADKDSTIAEAETKYSTLEAEKVELEKANSDLINEKEELVTFKSNVETEKKEAILLGYAEHLTDSKIEEFKGAMANYSVEDFDKEVCYAAAKNDPTIFNKNEEPERYFKGNQSEEKFMTGMERILNKYKNGGSK